MQVNLPLASSRDDELGPAREMGPADFHLVHQALRAQAMAALASSGTLAPTVFLPSMGLQAISRMGAMPVDDLVSEPIGKDILAMLMSRLIEDPNYDFVVFFHEAWILSAPAHDAERVEALRRAAQGSIERHPGRVEAALMHVRSKARQALCVMPIERSDDGSFSGLADGPLFFPNEDGGSFEGRFAPAVHPAGGLGPIQP